MFIFYNFMIMNNLDFIIKLLWPMFIIIWIWIILNKKSFVKMTDEIISSNAAMFMGWIIWLLIWLILLLSSFWWNTIWEIIISILWILATFKWIMLIIFPKHMKKISKNIIQPMEKFLPIIWIIYITIGVYLCFVWY